MTTLETLEPVPPKTATVSATTFLACGLLVGAIGDGLLRGGGPPGLGFSLWAATVAAAVLALHRNARLTLSREAVTWLTLGVAFAAVIAWRDSPPLKLLALAASATAFALPAWRSGAAWVRASGIGGYLAALIAAGLRGAFGGFLVLGEVDWGTLRRPTATRARWRRAAAVGRGVLIAIPILLLFGGLLSEADAVFADLVTESVEIDFEQFATHLALTGFLGWIAMGYLQGMVFGTRLPDLPMGGRRRPALGIGEVGVVLGLLGLLFLVFVLVQFRYLFGGAEMVEVTPGLTYAEYARRGFFELVLVSALLLPLLLLADWVLVRRGAGDNLVFQGIAAAHVLLILAMMASAVQRLRLYLAEFGLTESRLYAAALLAWLALLFIWFGATVLSGHRERFAFGGLVSAFVWVAALAIANPDSIIARTNLARAAAGSRVDVPYLASLSADAAPRLVGSISGLPDEARCPLAERLLARYGPEVRLDWRSSSISLTRARAATTAESADLRREVERAGGCTRISS